MTTITRLTPGRMAVAMKAGAKNLPDGQAENVLFRFNDWFPEDDGYHDTPPDNTQVLSACALGALAIGLGEDPIDLLQRTTQNGIYWPKNAPDPTVRCPDEFCEQSRDAFDDMVEEKNLDISFQAKLHGHQDSLSATIPHLNDNCGWGIDAIADWIKKSVRFPIDGT